ncbi:RHO1 GDP-GTP exchange protein 2 [Coemansia sp. RSA 485]|nr:RHO1 GDP-GTP exchange protein 2 [Coemansia sp. RSA 485]
MVHLPLAKTVHRHSLDVSLQSKKQQPTPQQQHAPNMRSSAMSSNNIVVHSVLASTQQQSSGNTRPSIEIRHEKTASNPAKTRMLWREGFTPQEIESSSMNEKEVKRQEVIFEIIHTEADYVKDLRILVDILLSPMRNLRVLPAEQIDLIFGNVQEILHLHEEINTAFMERQRKQYPVLWDICDVLLPFVKQFRVYARYICNQDKALRLVEDLRQSSNNFAVFHKERQRRPECRNLPMESFLTLPFQRLLKYPLLIQTLLKSTEEWSQQYANGRLVADNVDAWIKKIQDARTKLDSFACIDALSRCVSGLDWTGLLQNEHRLVHCGPVRIVSDPRNTAMSGNSSMVLDEPPASTMWLFDSFVIVARPEPVLSGPMSILPRASFSSGRSADVHDHRSANGSGSGDVGGGGGSSNGGIGGGGPGMPASDTRYKLVFGPCRLVEVLEIAQCKGSAAAYLHSVPAEGYEEMRQQSSIMVRFDTKSEHAMWKSKLNDHVRHTLQQSSSLSADVLADAIARAKIVDEGPASQCIGQVRSPPSSGMPTANASAMASVSDIPTISVREVYVQFPVTRQKGKLRRGWDFLCSKTEDITGQGIKRQLKKYGGGGGKRRATDPQPQIPARRRFSRSHSRGLSKASPVSAPKSVQSLLEQSLLLQPTQFASTPLLSEQTGPPPESPSYVHIPKSLGPSALNGENGMAVLPTAASRTVMPSRRPRNQTLPTLGIYQMPILDGKESTATVQSSTGNFAGSRESMVLKAYANYSCRRTDDPGAPSSSTTSLSPLGQLQLSRLEVGSATLAYSNSDAASVLLSAGTVASGKTFANHSQMLAPMDKPYVHNDDVEMSDSDMSFSEISSAFPEHMAGRSGSTLFALQPSDSTHSLNQIQIVSQSLPQMQGATNTQELRPKPLPIPPRGRVPRVATGARKPAPMFEVGSAKLTYGERQQPIIDNNTSTAFKQKHQQISTRSNNGPGSSIRTWSSKAHELVSNMPGFQSDHWHANSTLARHPPMRTWQAIDNDDPSSANSTDSFCIVNHEPQTPARVSSSLPRRRSSNVDRVDIGVRSSDLPGHIVGSSYEA